MAKAAEDPLEVLIDRAQATLVLDASGTAQKLAKTKLEGLAATLLLEWLVGDRRFESQSQQIEYWLSRFYEEIFIDEQPDAARIYERFAVSLPRAAYLARLLRARRAAQWRLAARKELKAQLERRKADAEQSKKDGQAHIDEFDVSLSPGAADELRVLYDRIAPFLPERERPKPPKPRPSFGNSRWLGVPAETLLLILNSLAKGDGS
jgi:hypothetical protein